MVQIDLVARQRTSVERLRKRHTNACRKLAHQLGALDSEAIATQKKTIDELFEALKREERTLARLQEREAQRERMQAGQS